ncbi:unnamed protein product [Caenorhabditis auriculariae]|uniref:Uncharacterized protein n=1 Tax=Caenorhabditis auriculariae TaxID=2777116 RepID=A0A8S1HEK0_9PELO|nr:unnamed protein product [Caenorhabditis auriculariae]
MPSWQQNLRAWLAILVLQSLGSVWMCYTAQKGSTHYNNPSPALSRAHALSVAMLALSRLAVIFSFESQVLHIVHIGMCVMTTFHTMAEVFVFESMKYGVANATEVMLNGLTSAIMCVALNSLIEREEKKERRRGRVTASHYMEGEILKPDEDSEVVRKFKKRQ